MDAIVNAILQAKKKDLDDLQKKLEMNIDKIRQFGGHISNALKALRPDENSLGITYLLFAKASLPKLDESFLNEVEGFVVALDGEQTRKAANRFVYVTNRYMELCRDNNLAVRGLRTLQVAVQRFRKSSEFLTPVHSQLLLLCLKTKNYKIGYNLIENKIFDVDTDITGLTPRDMLLYYYYGGMIYIGMKEFSKAYTFFDNAMQIPALALNAIMVESAKKLVLVSLLVHGKYLGISKNASNLVHRHMKTFCQIYIDFATAFERDDVDKAYKILNEHNQAIKDDKNLGLMKQCLSALHRRNIQKLTSTYVTLSLVDIAKAARLKDAKEAEQLLFKMIDNGQINARINQVDGMVTFEEDTESSNFASPFTNQTLDRSIQRTINFTKRLKKMDDEISTSTAYIVRSFGLREEMFDLEMMKGGSRGQRGMGAARLMEMWR
ncbi:hypothetical protein C9374_008670 [Naegleria lovaniensis]|uniref:COP9 signalosome complex subunit 3 n=1 Tax=Naegleria lovaniensis TaxID=51637 RepID=A0AA88GGE0_NAELO|nr:uncharacterized protein C9374_008670 [Naegleria lovaniensis]KAG2378048.1 hypothetical protein C9374_008670 [Naegleria lovaniensis]